MLEDGQIASLDPLTGKFRWAVAPPMSDRAYLGFGGVVVSVDL